MTLAAFTNLSISEFLFATYPIEYYPIFKLYHQCYGIVSQQLWESNQLLTLKSSYLQNGTVALLLVSDLKTWLYYCYDEPSC